MKTNYISLAVLALLYCLPMNLLAHVELDYPTGGETLSAGENVTIAWHETIPHNTLNWDLLYSPDGGMTWEFIQMDLPFGQTTFQWQVPEQATSLARVSVIQDNNGMDYQDESMNFTIQSSTAIPEPEIADFDFKVFPNPANETLTIQLDRNASLPTRISFFDLTGKSIWVETSISDEFSFPVEPYSPGIYYLQVEVQQDRYLKKVILY